MNVFVVTETVPSPNGDDTNVVGVYRRRADAVRRVNELFELECAEREWDLDKTADEHPESFTDMHGGVIGDMCEETGWVYWDITSHEVA